MQEGEDAENSQLGKYGLAFNRIIIRLNKFRRTCDASRRGCDSNVKRLRHWHNLTEREGGNSRGEFSLRIFGSMFSLAFGIRGNVERATIRARCHGYFDFRSSKVFAED